MQMNSIERTVISRRRLLGTITGASLCFYKVPQAFGAVEFWNNKDPSEWTTEEVLQLTRRSPWAKDARVEMRAGRQGGYGNSGGGIGPEIGGVPGGIGGRGIGGGPTPIDIGGDRNRDRRGQNSGQARGRDSDATVCWESAQPVRDALKYPVPADFADRYAIGVTGLPLTSEGDRRRDRSAATQDDMLDRLKSGASLTAKNRESEQAGVVQRARGGSVILFGFLKELLPLTEADKDVVFLLNTDEFKVTAKFNPKEMIYRGMLAV
jgi:hypothetical protein